MKSTKHSDTISLPIHFSRKKRFIHKSVAQGGIDGCGVVLRNLGWENIRPLQACVDASIRQRFRTVHATGYRSSQEGA